MIPQEAIVAAHSAICETNIDDCMGWRGRCVKAVEAAAPYLIREARAAELEAAAVMIDPEEGLFIFAWKDRNLLRERAAAIRAEQ